MQVYAALVVMHHQWVQGRAVGAGPVGAQQGAQEVVVVVERGHLLSVHDGSIRGGSLHFRWKCFSSTAGCCFIDPGIKRTENGYRNNFCKFSLTV